MSKLLPTLMLAAIGALSTPAFAKHEPMATSPMSASAQTPDRAARMNEAYANWKAANPHAERGARHHGARDGMHDGMHQRHHSHHGHGAHHGHHGQKAHGHPGKRHGRGDHAHPGHERRHGMGHPAPAAAPAVK